MNNEELDAIRKRAEDATPGPWVHSETIYVVTNVRGDSIEWEADLVAETQDLADAEFIAHARGDVPRLLAEIERLKGVAFELLDDYDCAERRVIDEVSTNRNFALRVHEGVIRAYTNDINGVDDDGKEKA